MIILFVRYPIDSVIKISRILTKIHYSTYMFKFQRHLDISVLQLSVPTIHTPLKQLLMKLTSKENGINSTIVAFDRLHKGKNIAWSSITDHDNSNYWTTINICDLTSLETEMTIIITTRREGNLALYATLNPFLLNKISLNQLVDWCKTKGLLPDTYIYS